MKILLLMGLLFGHLYAQDTLGTFHFKGYKTKVEWANKSNRLACQVNVEEQTVIHFMEPGRSTIVKAIPIPKELRVTTFTWTQDDKGLILATWDPEELQRGIYYLNISRGVITDTLPELGAYYQVNEIEGYEQWLAVASSGEGHPDVNVYSSDYEELFNTDVYPGNIALTGWCKGKLFVASDVHLEWGLTRDDRLKTMKKMGMSEEQMADYTSYVTEDWRVYAIDPETGKAKEANFPAGCGVYSFDGRFSYISSMDDEGLPEFDVTLVSKN
ncbi:MAG: hypothetical protein SF052_03910 [Bacteroidia bacterium]|nr:hypothetical protein [Bacteroidia bacterium]